MSQVGDEAAPEAAQDKPGRRTPPARPRRRRTGVKPEDAEKVVEKRKDVMRQIVENLRGEALNVAMYIGIEELYGENDAEKLMEQMTAYIFPIARRASNHLYREGIQLMTVYSYDRVASRCNHTSCAAGAGGRCWSSWTRQYTCRPITAATCSWMRLAFSRGRDR